MKLYFILLMVTFSFFAGECIGNSHNQHPVFVCDFYKPQNKEFWKKHVFPYDISPDISVKSNGINYTISICTNFIIYHVKTTDPDFVTQEGISPGMSFAQVKETLSHPPLQYKYTSYDFALTTNEASSIIFYLSLSNEYHAWFRGEYDSAVKAPDNNDTIVYINCGVRHRIIDKGAILITAEQVTNYFATKARLEAEKKNEPIFMEEIRSELNREIEECMKNLQSQIKVNKNNEKRINYIVKYIETHTRDYEHFQLQLRKYDKSAMLPLLNLLTNENAEVRLRASTVIFGILVDNKKGTPKTTEWIESKCSNWCTNLSPILIRTLKDKSPYLRTKAASCLLMIDKVKYAKVVADLINKDRENSENYIFFLTLFKCENYIPEEFKKGEDH